MLYVDIIKFKQNTQSTRSNYIEIIKFIYVFIYILDA